MKHLFGMGAVKIQENINLVAQSWNSGKRARCTTAWDWRTITPRSSAFSVPSLVIPVRPGRNLAIIVEVAAMNHRQKKMGYNAAKF